MKRKRIIETTGVEVGSSVRPMPAAQSFSNPPPLSLSMEEAADLGDAIGRGVLVFLGVALVVDAVVKHEKRKARGRR